VPSLELLLLLPLLLLLQVVCGHSHSLALAEGGAAYTWGNGNYGKLGHKVRQQRKLPCN
jgi:RCC1 and BTB domain-containing protein